MDVNDAISNFLGVVGLVYALIFSQQYADAQQRLREIQDNLSTEAGGIHICMNLVRVLDDRSRYMSAKIKVLLLLSSYVEDLAAHIDQLSGKQTSEHKGESYSPLESLYSVVPILAQICNDGNDRKNARSTQSRSRDSQASPRGRSRSPDGYNKEGSRELNDADVIDRLLLERTVDLINQVVQARLLRLTSEKRRISKWVWGLLILLAMSSFYGVLLIQGGSMIINLAFCGACLDCRGCLSRPPGSS